jgi:Ca2+-binding RTX toxin-like protein
MNANILHSAILFATNALSKFAIDPQFWQKFELAFGQEYNRVRAKEIHQSAVDGTFVLPIQILNDQSMGMAVGAFSATTETIYLRNSFVSDGDVAAIGAVILEELGHAIDAQVNKVETPGDEGAIFRLLVSGRKISADLLAKLKIEDDWGKILVNGQELIVEMAIINGSNDPENLVGTIDSDLINALGGDDTINAGIASVVGDGYGGNTVVILGSVGQETIDGGSGTDTLIVDYSENVNTNGGNLQGIKYSQFDPSSSGQFSVYKAGNSNIDSIQYSNIEKLKITGTQYADDIRGGNDSDTLIGGDGNDTINAGLGQDIVEGGSGTDTLIVDYSANVNTNGGSLQGIQVSSYDPANGNGSFYAYKAGNSTFDSVQYSNIEKFNITGTQYADDIRGGNSDNTLVGGAGNDTITAGTGNNIIDGGDGVDTLVNVDFSSETASLSIVDNGSTITTPNGSIISNVEFFSNVSTGSGNDSINFVQGDNNNIKTGTGNDTINAGLGRDTVDGGSGTDTLIVNYSANVNTNGGSLQGIQVSSYDPANGNGRFYAYKAGNSDVDIIQYANIEKFNITGTQYADDIRGGNSDDTFIGGDGNDTIDVGTGNDVVNAGDGNDTIITNDSTSASAVLAIDGGAGNDTLVNANFSAATANLSINNLGTTIALPNGSSISNIENFVNLTTGSGNDSINFVQGDNNNIKTGDGNDTINAGLGRDIVDGGSGTDTLVVDYAANVNTNGGSLQGIQVSSYDPANGNGRFYAYKAGNSDVDIIQYANIERFNITGTQYADDIRGGNSDDTLIGGAGNDTIDVGTGNDVVNAGDGNDTIITNDSTIASAVLSIDGGAGSDTLINANFSAATANLSIDNSGTAIILPNGSSISNVENFVNLTTGSGNDSINFVQGDNNNIKTGAGNDTINAGLGRDVVDGGSGTDTLVVDYAANVNTNGGSLQGIQVSSYDPANGNGRFYAYKAGNSDVDIIQYANVEKFNITGTQYADDIRGGNSDDTLIGGAGNDTIDVGTGNDVVNAGDGNDTIITNDSTSASAVLSIDGGTGNDTLVNANFSAATANLSINNLGTTIALPNGSSISNVENFVNLTTGSGNDSINFVQGDNNNVKTGDGNDTINAGLGRDTVDGGSGTDTLIVDYSANVNTNGGSLQGIQVSGYDPANGNGRFYAYKAGNSDVDIIQYANVEKFNITGTQYADDIRGGNSDDTLIGGAGNDTIDGGSGNDIINGIDLGRSSNNGTGEVDFLRGGAGSDRFILGDNVNSYYDDQNIASSGGSDYAIIADFNQNEDRIQLHGTASDYRLVVSGANTNLYIDKAGTEIDELIGVFQNITGLNLSSNAFQYVAAVNNISFSANTYNLSEGNLAQITLYRTGDNVGQNSITLNLTNGSATAPTDYIGTPIIVTFNDGESSKVVNIPIIDDLSLESTENLIITLSDPTNGGMIDGNNQATINIADNEVNQSVSLINSNLVVVGNTSLNTVVRNKTPLEIIYTVNNIPAKGVLGLNFNPLKAGDTFTQADINSEKLSYQPSVGADGQDFFTFSVSDGSSTLTSQSFNFINSPPAILSFSQPTYIVNEDGTANTAIAITRAGGAVNAVSATVILSNGTAIAPADFNGNPITVNFAAGDTAPKTIIVPIVDDTIFEGDETVNLILSNPTGGAIVGSQNTTVLTVINNDLPQPGILAFANSSYSVNENGVPSVTLLRTSGSNGAVAVSIAFTNGTALSPADYNNVPIEVSFADGETSKVLILNSLVNDDTTYEPTENLTLTLSQPTGGAAIGSQSSTILNIIDNDAAPGIVQFSATNYSVAEDGVPFVAISLVRTGGVDGAISVQVNLADGTATAPNDYLNSSITVSFANGESSKTVIVPIVDDSILELSETINLSLANPQGGAAVGSQNTATLTIVDNESPNLRVSINQNAIAEDAIATATVLRNTNDVSSDLVVNLVSSDVQQATVPNTVTILAGQNSATFAVAGVNDGLNDGAKSVTITATTAGLVSGATSLQITDINIPDLVVTENTLAAPTSVNLGESITVSWQVANISAVGPAAAQWDDNIYISADATLSDDDVTVGSQRSTTVTPLAIQSSYSASQNITLNSLSLLGDKYLIVAADRNNTQVELNDSNNFRAKAIQIKAADLIAKSVTVAGSNLGGAANITWTVENIGNGAATASRRDRVYLSRNGVVDNNAVLLVVRDINTSITAGATHTESASVNLPLDPSYTSGNYYFILKTDDLNTQVETNEVNNTKIETVALIVPPTPNLVVANLSIPNNELSGKRIPISWETKNTGTADIVGKSWQELVYLSSDNIAGNADDVLFDSVTVGDTNLAIGESLTRQREITLPIDAQGSRWLVVKTDTSNNIYEHVGEADNTSISTSPIDITLSLFPNLQVTSITPPSNSFSGASTLVSWQVTNTGGAATSSPYWYDKVWLSQDDTLDINGDYELVTVVNPSFLAPGTSYISSATVQIPRGLDNSLNQGWRFILQTDAGAFRVSPSVYEYNKEDDNITASTPFPITTTPPPDLRVTSVTVAPSSPFSGQKATVTWAVENRGTGRTLPSETKWTDELFIAKNADGSGESYSLGRFEHLGGLTALDLNSDADRYTNTQIVDLPIGKWGDYFFVVKTDVGNTVFEQAFEDNNSGFLDANTQDSIDTPTQIKLTPPPDLTVLTVSSAANAVAGKTIDVAYKVANDGTTGVPARTSRWTDSFFLSTTANFDPNTALFIGQKSYDNQGLVFAAGSIYNSAATLTIPKELAAGNYYVFAYTDRGNEIFEQDDVDAILGGTSIALANLKATAQPITVVSRPADFVVTNANAIGNLNAGKVGRFTWTVLNQGTGDSNATSWIDRLTLSRNGVIGDSDDYRLAEISRSVGTLQAGGTYTRTEDITLPFELIGDYNLFVTTDSSSLNDVYEADKEGNNTSVARPITINRLTPDLAAQSVTGVDTAVAGSNISVGWSVKNIGEGLTNADYWYDSVYLSKNENLDIGDTRLNIVRRNGSLTVNDAYTGTAGIILPKNIQGEYYLLAVADNDTRYNGEGNRVLEISEANNLAAKKINITINPVPDLLVTIVDAAATGISGQDLDVSWTVRNNNTTAIAAADKWRDSVYLSRDRILDRNNGDILLGSVEHTSGLSGNSSYTESTRFDIPRGLSGAYYIFVATDDYYGTSKIEEREGEQNNTTYDSTATQIIIAPPADLAPIANSFNFAGSGVAGEFLTVSYQVENKGGDTALGRWTDTLYLSKDGTWDLNDAVLGSFEHSGDVLPNGIYNGNVTAKIPGVVPGDYRVIVRSDVRDGVPDTNPANDTVASTNTTNIDFATLSVGGGALNGSLAQGQAVYYKFQGTAGKAVRLKLDSVDNAGANGLYVKYGNVPTRGQFDRTDTNPFNPDPDIIVPIGQDGTYYVMAYGNSVSGAPNYTITATEVPFSISNVETKILGNVGKASIKVEGALFEEGTTFQLIDSAGNVVNQLSDKFKDSTVDFATFDLTGKTAGKYDLRAIQANGASTTVDDVITVQNGVGANIISAIDGPSAVWAGTKYPIAINYGNSGDTDSTASLIIVQADDKASVGSNPRYESEQQRGKLVQIFGAGSDVGQNVLRPQESHSVPVYFTSLGSVDLGTVGGASVSEYSTNNSNRISSSDWILLRDSVKPVNVSTEQWNAFWSQNQSNMGTTWGDYTKHVTNLAAAYTQPNENATDVGQFFDRWYQDTGSQYFQIKPLTTFNGRLVTDNGKLVGDVVVKIYKENADGSVTQISSDDSFSANYIKTDADGRFSVASLDAGNYQVVLTDSSEYLFRPLAEIQASTNLNDSYVHKFSIGNNGGTQSSDINAYSTDPIASPPQDFKPGASQLRIIQDVGKVTHIFWIQDNQSSNQLWHAYYNGSAWVDAAPVKGARYIEGSYEVKSGVNGLIIAWSGSNLVNVDAKSENETEIYYAVSRTRQGGGFEFSQPISLTKDEFADSNPDFAIADNGKTVFVHQKMNAAVVDDSDLYYKVVDAGVNTATWYSNSASGSSLLSESPSDGFAATNAGGGAAIPKGILVVGGYEFKLVGYGVAKWDNDCKGATAESTTKIEGELGGKAADAGPKAWVPNLNGDSFKWKGQGSYEGSAKWDRPKKNGPYELSSSKGKLNIAVSYEDTRVLNKLPAQIVVPLKTIEGVLNFFLGDTEITSGLRGKLSFTEKHSVTRNSEPVSERQVGAAAEIFAKVKLGKDKMPGFKNSAFEGELGGSVFGTLNWTSKKGFYGSIGAGLYAKAKLAAFGFGVFFFPGYEATARYVVNQTFGGSNLEIDPSSVLNSYISNLGSNATSVELTETFGTTNTPLVLSSGTNATYGDNTVLSTASSDVLFDEAPAVAKALNGQISSAWVKQGDPNDPTALNSLIISQFNGTNWNSPITVTKSDRISDVNLTFDSNNRPVLVWTDFDASVFASSVANPTSLEELKTLMQSIGNATNVFYSTQDINGNWTTPATVTNTTGIDLDVRATQLSNGQTVLTWVNESNGTRNLLATFWNGTAWTTPTQVASGNIGNPDVSLVSDGIQIFWSQRAGFEPSTDKYAEDIYSSTYDPTSQQWSSSQLFNPILTIGSSLTTGSSAFTESPSALDLPGVPAGFPGLPPAECPCKEDPKTYCPPLRQSADPNDILGPDGYGAEKWTNVNNPLDYIIRFENVATSTAPAKVITVTQQLDADLDWRSFRLGSFNWGDISIQAPENSAFFSERIDLVSKYGVFVDVSASIDVRTGIASWELRSIDPSTGDTPIDPLKGFLPPNDPNNKGVGEGNVSYYIKAKSNVTTGTRIDAEARIIFDTNEAIDTPKIFNTLDVEKPISTINVLPTQSINPEFQISWTGGDETTGSGIAGYNFYAAVVGEEYELLAEGLTETEITFLGEAGKSYNFYTLAIDNAGNIQDIATSTPATISIGGPGVISFTAAEYSVNESGAAIASVTVQRTNGSLGAVSATVDFNGGTASGGAQPFYSGLDYDNTSILVNFADGETSKVITVPINNDTLTEGNETVNLALSKVTGGATLGDRATAQLTIVDESIQLNFARTNFRINENGVAVNEIQVTRTGKADVAVGATLSLTDITATGALDYIASPIQVAFAAGETTKTFVVPVTNDTLAEGDETIKLQLINPTNGAAIGSNGQAVLTVVDDETNLKFNITADSGINTQAIAGFTAAANNWSKTFSNNATINVSVVFQDLGAGTLGQSVAERANYSYSNVYTALSNGRRSADDDQAVANLQIGADFDLLLNRTTNNPNGNGSLTPYLDSDGDANNSTIRLNRANAKALGLVAANATGNDTTLIFNSNSGLKWDFDPTDGITAGSYDFIGLATHEIGHALGFESGVDVVDTNSPAADNEYTYVSALDLFRFSTASSAQGAIDFTASNTDKYFSINGGATKIASFATGVNNGDGRQPQHWKDALGLGLLDPTVAPGERLQITELDKQAFDVIGWNLASTSIALSTVKNDFGNDRKSDILWRNKDGRVVIWQMNGSTVVANSLVDRPAPFNWQVVSTGDFDGDYQADILWRNTDGRVAIWRMDGSMVVADEFINKPSPLEWQIFGTADFNGDKKSDILWRGNDGRVVIWRMDGSRVIADEFINRPTTLDWKIAGTADFNGDGKSDILWRNANGQLKIWQMDGSTVIADELISRPATLDWQIADTTDFNGDGKSDILWRNLDGRLVTWQMNGSTVIADEFINRSAPLNSQIASTGDFNGDGKSDILWRDTDGHLVEWWMNGSAVIADTQLAELAVDGFKAVKNDFNNDKKSDILWRNTDGQVVIWQMDGSQVLADEFINKPSPLEWQIFGTADFNGDKKSDILWRGNDGRVVIWQMGGTSVINDSFVDRPSPLDWQIAGTGDFGGDGKSDILWRGNDGRVVIWQMDGSQVLVDSFVDRPVNLDWQIAGTGDFNGDGKSDILWRSNSGATIVSLMNGATVTSEAEIRQVANEWVIEGVDDFNGDGKSDILWQNTNTGNTYIYQMNGLTIANEGAIGVAASDLHVAGTGDFSGDGKSDILWRSNSGATSLWTIDGLNKLGEKSIRQVDNAWQIVAQTI